VIWAGLLLGCALRGVPHYETVGFELRGGDDGERSAWADWVRRDLQRGRLKALHVDGQPVPTEALPDVPWQALYAVFAVNQGWARSAELDLWVPDGEARWPVTVHFDPDRTATVWLGSPMEAPRLPPATASVQGRLVDGDAVWTDEEARVVQAVFARLSDAEVQRLDGLTFRRQGVSHRAPGRELAWFDPTTEPPVIDVYDLAFAPSSAFVGPVEEPLPAATLTIAHELAHALADWPLRRAFLGQAPPVGRLGPVMEAWSDQRFGRGPTRYGTKSPHEAFAEAFALYLLDRDALRRALPRAVAWFDEGGHLPPPAPAMTDGVGSASLAP
jgi:hypothetical protein